MCGGGRASTTPATQFCSILYNVYAYGELDSLLCIRILYSSRDVCMCFGI